MEKRTLTDDEVRSLKTILIEGNSKITGVRTYNGYEYYGAFGGGHQFVTESSDDHPLEFFAGRPPFAAYGMYLRAVVCDTVYLTDSLHEDAAVATFGVGGSYARDDAAYDTRIFYVICPICG